MNLPPARTFLEFATSFKSCLLKTKSHLATIGCDIEARASLDFNSSEIDDLEATIFGCEPEYCIYNTTPTGKIMRVEPPNLPEGSTFRSCGGHVHIGHVIANIELGGRPGEIIKLMDGLVGVISVLLDKDPTSLARRKIYGGAGSHRITPYGTEYRTPSNFWLTNPRVTEIVYKLTRLAVEFALVNPNFINNLIDNVSLQKLINTSNVKDAQTLYESYAHSLPYELQKAIEVGQTVHTDRFLSGWTEVKTLAA